MKIKDFLKVCEYRTNIYVYYEHYKNQCSVAATGDCYEEISCEECEHSSFVLKEECCYVGYADNLPIKYADEKIISIFDFINMNDLRTGKYLSSRNWESYIKIKIKGE